MRQRVLKTHCIFSCVNGSSAKPETVLPPAPWPAIVGALGCVSTGQYLPMMMASDGRPKSAVMAPLFVTVTVSVIVAQWSSRYYGNTRLFFAEQGVNIHHVTPDDIC